MADEDRVAVLQHAKKQLIDHRHALARELAGDHKPVEMVTTIDEFLQYHRAIAAIGEVIEEEKKARSGGPPMSR
jgi:hypothetical protein